MKRLLVAVLIVTGIAQTTSAQESVVKATIKRLGQDSVFIQFNPLSAYAYQDTLLTDGDSFTYKVNVDKPILASITCKKSLSPNTPANRFYLPQSKRINIVLIPGDTTIINGELTRYSLIHSVEGAPVNRELNEQFMRVIDKRIAYFKLELKIDSLFKIGQPQNVQPLMEEMYKFKAYWDVNRKDVIKNNPDKDFSVLYLVGSNNREFFDEYIDFLTPRVRNGIFKDLLDERIALFGNALNAKNVIVGAIAPQITSTDISGNAFKLSEKRGKYVLLDFWGSWCMPCIKGFPKMKEYNEKYKDQVEFVSIACNDKEDIWRKAVNKYDLKWTQLLNVRGVNSVTSMYGISLYPTKILIDRNGVIVLNFSGEGEDFYKKLDTILKQ